MRDPFRNFTTYKIDPLSEIRNMGIVTNGEVFWVSSENDSDHRERTDLLGNSIVKLTLQAATDAAEDNGNDYILVVPTDAGTAPTSERTTTVSSSSAPAAGEMEAVSKVVLSVAPGARVMGAPLTGTVGSVTSPPVRVVLPVLVTAKA